MDTLSRDSEPVFDISDVPWPIEVPTTRSVGGKSSTVQSTWLNSGLSVRYASVTGCSAMRTRRWLLGLYDSRMEWFIICGANLNYRMADQSKHLKLHPLCDFERKIEFLFMRQNRSHFTVHNRMYKIDLHSVGSVEIILFRHLLVWNSRSMRAA